MIDYAGEKTVYGEIISKEKVKNTIGKLKLDNKIIRPEKRILAKVWWKA